MQTTTVTPIITRNSFKRGDTACFLYVFSPPYVGYSWSGVTIDCTLTSATAPIDNSAAMAIRTAQTLTVDASNNASYAFQLTVTESKSLTPGTTYMDECQLKEPGGYVVTPITGKTTISQDYVI